MGLFDLFKGKAKDGEKKKASPAAKWAGLAGSKRAQAYDRQEAIQELSKIATADAASSGEQLNFTRIRIQEVSSRHSGAFQAETCPMTACPPSWMWTCSTRRICLAAAILLLGILAGPTFGALQDSPPGAW